MSKTLNHVKALLCDCGCAWAVENDETKCWYCHSLGPHTVTTTTANSPKIFYIISSLDKEDLFSEIEG